MSLVPVTGPATFRPGEVPRDSSVEFSDERRTVSLPVRAALPVLGRAHREGGAHPTVLLLSGACLLGLRLVAAGRFTPSTTGEGWHPVLDSDDEDRVVQLARARADAGHGEEAAREIVRAVVDAVVDAMPGSPPTTGRSRGAAVVRPGRGRAAGRPGGTPSGQQEFVRTLQQRIARARARSGDERPQVVRLSLRVEADEELLHVGSLRLVPQVQDERDSLHVSDAVALWHESGPEAGHGFGDRARTHASLALRRAAEAWPVLDQLLDLPVPDALELTGDEVVDLLESGLQRLADAGVDVHWPRELGRDLSSRAVLDRTASRSSGAAPESALQDSLLGPESLFAFRWQVSLQGERLTDEEMARLARAATPLVRLRDNWVVVDPETARRARRRLIRTVRPAQAVAAALTGVAEVEDRPDVEVSVGASLTRVRDQLLREVGDRPPVPVPDGLAATLRDYQREGLTWLAGLTDLGLGGCLADDMGLGKTVQLIALHLHRRARGHDAPTLVVCPASLLGNWEAEVRRFAPGVPVRRFHGGSRSLAGADDGFVLTTYGTLRSDAGADAALASTTWDLVVADEAQHVKNSRTSTARALRGLESRARVALTGTPVENDLTELWSILDWTVPGLLGSRQAFRRTWAAPIEAGVDDAVTRRFARLVGPFLLRRRKTDPGIAPELPRKTETDHLLGLTREQTVLYESFVRDRMERIERADPEARRGLVLALLTGLKQICNHPAQFLKEGNPRLVGRSEKLELLDELLDTVLAEDGAVLVFTQYVAMARLLERHLRRAGVAHLFLHGGTSVGERESMVQAFQSGQVPVFLLSLKAGGTGLNLTRADHVIHFDRWWNPAVEDQATDRAYRIGQTRPVQVHRFVTVGTVEERVAELLARKRTVADSVLARDDTGLGALTELPDDELRSLVELR